MGMFYCRDCKQETNAQKCKYCGGDNTYKYWWTFPDPTGKNKGIKIFYDEQGNELRRAPY